MKKLRLIVAFSLAAICGGWAPAQEKTPPIDLKSPLPTVVLKDGRTLHNLRIVSFGGATIMAKWDGGRGTIAYAALPDEVRKEMEFIFADRVEDVLLAVVPGLIMAPALAA